MQTDANNENENVLTAENIAEKNVEAAEKTGEAPHHAEPERRKIRRVVLILAVIMLFAAALIFFFRYDFAYVFAQWRFDCKDYSSAKSIFLSLGDFHDSRDYLTRIYYSDARNFPAR
jgi:predicted membrane protein